MYRRRNSSNPLGKFLAGIVIIIGAVIIFLFYQNRQQPTLVQPTVAAPVAASPTPQSQQPTQLPPAQQPQGQSRILAGKANISAPIIPVYYGRTENWDVSRLGSYAGHIQGSNDYGTNGNYVLIGHVELKDGSQGAFAQLDTLQINDIITLMLVTSGGTQFVPYIVTDSKIVDSDDMSVIRNHGFEELTLLTCRDYSPDEATYKRRYVVHAKPLKDKNAVSTIITPKK
jgi:LPXTG-site transpeptidase (sortase) family protein